MQSEDGQNRQRDPPPEGGRVSGLLNAVKGLTVTNVIVIILLAFVAGPAYVIYRALNDENLLDRFLSHYREVSSEESNCLIREIRQRGGPDAWGIATGFAYYGSDRWQMGVIVNRQPNREDILSYCATLNLLVDHMRDPTPTMPPTFPGTDKPVIQMHQDFPPDAFGGPR